MKIENRMQLHLWREECKEKRQKETCRVLICAFPLFSRKTGSVLICGGTGCLAGGSDKIYARIKELTANMSNVTVKFGEEIAHVGLKMSGCHGFCEMGPLVRIEPYNYLYLKVKLEDCEEIFEKTILRGEPVTRLMYEDSGRVYETQEEIPFYAKQTRLVLKNCGHIDAEHIEDAMAVGAYEAFEKAVFEMTPEAGLEITIEQEKEFQNEITEAEILDEAGLPASDYEITQIEKGEDGKLVARGRKKVFDCRAVYSGLIAEKDWDREEMPDTDLKREWEQDVELKPAVTGSKFVGKMVLAVVTGSCVGIGAYWILKKGKLNKASLKIREKRRILGIILLTGAAAGIVYTGNTVRKYRLAAEKYESIRREVQKTETSYAQDHSGTSIDEITIEEAKLKEINPDYNCWIRIPGTSIDYPAVWGKDDKYYLDHGFNGEKQSGGTIFADSQNIPFVSANTIFYGHNMKDGSMFGDLKKYRDPGFLKEHPNVEIFYQGQWITCPIILAKVTDETDGTPYQKGERKILTLSTCYGTSKRMILQALIPVAGGMN